MHLRFQLDQIDHTAIEAIRAWRVGYQNAGGTVVKEPLDVLWRKLMPRSATATTTAAA